MATLALLFLRTPGSRPAFLTPAPVEAFGVAVFEVAVAMMGLVVINGAVVELI
jgi:hypothetical protein